MVIQALDSDTRDDQCFSGGMLLHCTANNENNPWHNFVSDHSHWKVDVDKPFCEPNRWYYNSGRSQHPFLAQLFEAGAKDIWVDAKEVTFTGSPHLM